ncbi:MAG: ABC transporter permease, partial [Cyclobacteriaceae bacterium]|nr:ABC transporter permease [Cyclobacteriaceae bacterium]
MKENTKTPSLLYTFEWLIKMAWRDSRKSRGKLVLFIASISLGIAALTGISSFRENLLTEIDNQAKSLLGADFLVQGNAPLPDSLFYSFHALSRSSSREIYFASMIYFPRTDGTRLVQVRALEGDYPYYGEIGTDPIPASQSFQSGKYALVDEKLMIQYNVETGDSIRVGSTGFVITGKIKQVPGQSSMGSSVSPVVYIPMAYLDDTQLIQKGSRVNYLTYFQFHPDIDTSRVWESARKTAEDKGFDVETIEDRKENTGRSFKDLSSFLELIAFAALLLGCLGVSGSVYVYAQGKIESVAILRCLGMKSRQAISIYLIQIVSFGLTGALMGSLLGVVIQMYLPRIAAGFLPVDLIPHIYWPAIVAGLVIGLVISFLFGLLSLLSLRKISPLTALRFEVETIKSWKDPWAIAVAISILFFIFVALWVQLGHAMDALSYSGILLGSIVLLMLLGKGLTWAIRKMLPPALPFAWRQGLSNLYRPHNQTITLITTLGLSTAFLGMLYFMQALLVQRITLTGKDDRPNTILFDIQSHQVAAIRELTKEYDLPVLQEVPIVTMRLIEINGQSKDQAEKDTLNPIPDWAYNREYRITYRDSLINSETLAGGIWSGKAVKPSDSIFISISKGFAESLNLELGDELLFNVQGAMIRTYIGSFRDIDWRRVQTNFLVVFPTGVLEKAPQFHVLITRVQEGSVSARYQQAVVRQFPNVSVIDLELILKTLEEILGKVAFVIQFMALFSIGTGLVVMISSIVLSKYQRMQENVLLRTLGASQSQLWKIIAAEYVTLGSMGAL